jgi:hypothetical protein
MTDFESLGELVRFRETENTYRGSNLTRLVGHLKEKAGGVELSVDAFFILYKLRQLCFYQNLKNISGVVIDLRFTEQVLSALDEDEFAMNELLQAYFLVYKFLQATDNEAAFRKLVLLIPRLQPYEHDLPEIFSYAQNFCLRKINSGALEYQQQLFGLYKTSLDMHVMTRHGRLMESNFKNICALALRIGEFDWTKQFIKKYNNLLPEERRDNAVKFNYAGYYFYLKKYGLVLKTLQQVQINDLFYGLDARVLLLKSYYELDEKEAFDNLADTFKTFLRRKKAVAESHRQSYGNFLRLAKQLNQLRTGRAEQAKLLGHDIEKAKPCADKGWLLAKLKEKEETGIGRKKKPQGSF